MVAVKTARVFIGAIFIAVFLFLFPSVCRAAFSLAIESITPTSISYNEQEVTAKINISGLPSESYFRVAWQESSGKPYFGYIKNSNGDWVKIESSQDCKNYYKVSDLTTTSLSIITKIGEENTVTTGSYLLKVRRYTASCSSYTDSDAVTIQVNVPTPTSTPVPTSTPTPTPRPTPTSSPTPTPTPKPTATPIPSTVQLIAPTASISGVLGVKIVTSAKTKEGKALTTLGKDQAKGNEIKVLGIASNDFSKILIIVGVLIIVGCGILNIYLHKRQSRSTDSLL